jgi:hypothetical protein
MVNNVIQLTEEAGKAAKQSGLPAVPSLVVVLDCDCVVFYGRHFESGELWEVKKECIHCQAKELYAQWQEFQLSRNP